jgi:hypothetical protein
VPKALISLTEGCNAALRLLAPRVPDGLFVAGLVCFGVGVWKFDPRAVWMYSGAACVWLAFGLASAAKGGQQ